MVSSLMIGGFPVRMEQPLAWTQYQGTDARIYQFPVAKKDAEKILKISDPIEFSFKGANRKRERFKNLYVVGEGTPLTPFHRVIKVADSRWFWRTNHISANYNTPRVTTNRRVISPPGVPLEVAQIEPDVAFAALSLKRSPGAPLQSPGRPWKAREVLEDILDRVAGKGKWKIRAQNFPQGLVDGTLIDDPGDAAVAKGLALCPGLTCFQDKDGMIIVDSFLPGTADKIIQSLGDPLGTAGVIRKIDLSLARAEAFELLTTRELGYRFDFKEGTNKTSTTTTGLDPHNDRPFLINMMETTLPETLINGERVPMGNWEKVDDLLPVMHLWLLQHGPKLLQETLLEWPLNHENVRRFWPSRLEQIYARNTNDDLSDFKPAVRFIDSLRRHYRQTFMVNPVYADGAIRFLPKAPGLISPETGAEQAPPIYLDYAVQPSSSGFIRDPRAKFLLFNVDNAVAPYWENGRLVDGTVSPASFTMLSEQLGIFRINLSTDLIGERHQVFVGKVEADPKFGGSKASLPSSDYRNPIATLNQCSLASDHEMNVIFSIVPGVPNTDARHHRVRVTIKDVEQRFKVKIGEGRSGLVTEQRVRGGSVVASFPYDEGKYEEVKKVLGIVPGKPDLGDPINQEALKELTLAAGFVYWLGKRDHYAGTQAVPLRGDIEPIGEITEVQHTLDEKGRLQTLVTCEVQDFEAFDPMALLPQSARRTLQRAINPVGA